MDTPLTANGERQARMTAGIFERAVRDPAAFAFVSSPLGRARATMEIVRSTLGLAPGGYATDERLVEINLGEWEGLTKAEAKSRFPIAYEERAADRGNIRVPGGENYIDVAARAESWIADVSADTFAVSHGAFTRILRGLFAGLDWQAMSDLDEPQGVVFRVRDNYVERLEARADG